MALAIYSSRCALLQRYDIQRTYVSFERSHVGYTQKMLRQSLFRSIPILELLTDNDGVVAAFMWLRAPLIVAKLQIPAVRTTAGFAPAVS